jgi:hypothetical protein
VGFSEGTAVGLLLSVGPELGLELGSALKVGLALGAWLGLVEVLGAIETEGPYVGLPLGEVDTLG